MYYFVRFMSRIMLNTNNTSKNNYTMQVCSEPFLKLILNRLFMGEKTSIVKTR